MAFNQVLVETDRRAAHSEQVAQAFVDRGTALD
jgi:hypothetical protein